MNKKWDNFVHKKHSFNKLTKKSKSQYCYCKKEQLDSMRRLTPQKLVLSTYCCNTTWGLFNFSVPKKYP